MPAIPRKNDTVKNRGTYRSSQLIFKISSNIGADLMLCLMAARAGSTNCDNGFPVMASLLARAHVDRTQVVLTDGHGCPNDRFTPQTVTDLLRYWLGRPEFARFRQMLPILGEHGNLSGICDNCPARGKDFANPGTVAAYDTFNNRLFLSEALGLPGGEAGQVRHLRSRDQ